MIRDSNLIAIFFEKQREKVDLNFFLKWFDWRLIRESKIHNFSLLKIRKSLMIQIKIRSWFPTHESEFFDSAWDVTRSF